jgi:nitrite reductase/ring-hydroxylating ferredoxin subunit
MAELVKVARRDAIAEGSAKVVEANGRKIALFNFGGQFYAIANECRHEGASLGDGDVYGTRVVCPLHGWEYDFTTGCNVDDPSVTLRRYTVKLDGDDLLIEL